MADISFSKEQRRDIEGEIQGYLKTEFGLEISSFDAGFFLDFLMKDIGQHFYNQGLTDAAAMLQKRLEALTEDILALQK